MALDFLAFGPHPDDADIGCGGLLRKMKALGYSTGVVDMTTGDMGWGTPEIRANESAEAARILQLDVRENLDLGDCRIEDTFENRCKVAGLIRKHRPQIVLSPYYQLPIGAKVFDAGAMNFGGTAELPPVRQLLENLWNRLSRP